MEKGSGTVLGLTKVNPSLHWSHCGPGSRRGLVSIATGEDLSLTKMSSQKHINKAFLHIAEDQDKNSTRKPSMKVKTPWPLFLKSEKILRESRQVLLMALSAHHAAFVLPSVCLLPLLSPFKWSLLPKLPPSLHLSLI